MNWEAIGAIGEVVGALAVIATLLYLAVQIRQNTKAIKGTTLTAITEHKQFELRWSSDIATAWRKSLTDPKSLTPDESWQMAEWLSSCFVARQNEFFQHKQGLIDDETWEASERIIKLALSGEWARNWWNEFGPKGFTENFVYVVDKVLSDSDVDYAEIIENIDRPSGTNEGNKGALPTHLGTADE
ncbi:MAG: hypothetical protein OEQ39_20095 [Gammaproteobacteria bacterium]|nr:hypothetical protein [Gammaproteobacteria bacterium]